jgi:hypothetical protein
MEQAIAAHPSQLPREKGVSGFVLYGLFGVGAIALLLGAASLSVAYNTLAFKADVRADHSAGLAQIDRDSQTNKALFERYAEMGDSMTLNGYNCNAAERPLFDAVPWAKADETRAVYSADDYHVGNVNPDGTYTHFGYCSK